MGSPPSESETYKGDGGDGDATTAVTLTVMGKRKKVAGREQPIPAPERQHKNASHRQKRWSPCTSEGETTWVRKRHGWRDV